MKNPFHILAIAGLPPAAEPNAMPLEGICIELWQFIFLLLLSFLVGCLVGWFKLH